MSREREGADGRDRAPANVALIVETSVVYGREILRGISRHQAVHRGWSLFLDERELDAPPPEWLAGWEGDGIILRSTTPALAAELRARGIAAVDLNDRYGDLGLPRIASDMRAIGRLAAEHLLARGYGAIAYLGFEGEAWCDARLAGVRERVEPCGVLRTPWGGRRERAWPAERDAIGEWLDGLPRPLGVVACNDVRGHHALDACRARGIAVPEEVAVVGVDNAETFCALCDPPLSSVVPDAARIGYEAAALLDGLLRGDPAPTGTRLVAPKRVATRQSTDSVAITDPLVARGVRFIREGARNTIAVEDVLARTGVSRSTLERRFRAALGRSPHDEIVRARVRRVQTLLRETDWSVARVAAEAGFEHPEYMMVQFKRETGRTPSEWRADDRAERAAAADL